jgi:hypothetical protein
MNEKLQGRAKLRDAQRARDTANSLIAAAQASVTRAQQNVDRKKKAIALIEEALRQSMAAHVKVVAQAMRMDGEPPVAKDELSESLATEQIKGQVDLDTAVDALKELGDELFAKQEELSATNTSIDTEVDNVRAFDVDTIAAEFRVVRGRLEELQGLIIGAAHLIPGAGLQNPAGDQSAFANAVRRAMRVLYEPAKTYRAGLDPEIVAKVRWSQYRLQLHANPDVVFDAKDPAMVEVASAEILFAAE